MSYKELDPFNYNDLKPQNYKSKQNLISDLEEISKNIENITNDWKERELSLQKIGKISKGNLSQSEVFIKYFNSKLCNNIEIQLSDLRSSVMKEACRITSLCSRELGLLIEPGIAQLLSQSCLFKIAGSANKVIADSSSKCILNIVRYVQCFKVINNICEIKTMKANNVRILCAQCLVNIISYYENNFIIKSKDIIEDTIKSLLVDANAEVRSTTRKAFILYKSRFGEEGEILFNKLGKNVQKQINEDEKNFDKNLIITKHDKGDKYLKSITKELDDNNSNKIIYLDNIQNKPKTPEFNIIINKDSNSLNKKDNSNYSNKNNIIKKIKSNKKSVIKNVKKKIEEEKEEPVKYINVDDDMEDIGVGYIDLNDNEEEKEKDKLEELETDTDISKKQNNKDDSRELNAVFNYSNKQIKKPENKNDSKIGFNRKSPKFESSINKLINSKKLKDNTDNKLYQSQNFKNNYLDFNKNSNNSNPNNNINDFDIDDLINIKDSNNSNNKKKQKKFIIKNNKKIIKVKSNFNTERTKNNEPNKRNTKNSRTKSKNLPINEINIKTNIEKNTNKKQILKRLNTKFEQLESGAIVLSSGDQIIQKNNYINERKNRGKSEEKKGIINYEFNKKRYTNIPKITNNNININNNISKSKKYRESPKHKNINLYENEYDSISKRKMLTKIEIKDNDKISKTNEEENELEEELDTVIDIDLIKKGDKVKNFKKNNNININNNVTSKEKINQKTNTYHFSKSNNKYNKINNNVISTEIFINNALDSNNNSNNNIINSNKEEIISNNESIEDKINVIIDKLDNLINQNEKLILFQYLFNYFNSTLQEIKNFSQNTIKRYKDIHIENLKENDKNLIEQILKNLMRMIFYMNQIFNTYDIESILKILLFSINDINDKTINKLSNQLLEIIKKKCDNEELFKSVYSLLGEFNSNYDNCYDFMYLIIPGCDNILNNNNYFKQVFRLICLTEKNSKKVGKIIDILYRKYASNFNQAYEEETPENKKQILTFMEKTNSLYFREFKSSHEKEGKTNKSKNSKLIDKKIINISQDKKENDINSVEIINKDNISDKSNISNISNKSANLSNNIKYKNNIVYNQNNKSTNNIVYNQNNKSTNNINTISANINGNNIISINNSNNNNIIITNKLPDESIPDEVKMSIQNNNYEQYILYMEKHKSYIPEFMLLLSNKKYSDDNSTITLLNFTKNILNSNNFSIDLNACINLMVKQLIYILTSHKNNDKIVELIKNILSDMPINLNANKTLTSMAKFLNIDNETIILGILLLSIQNFIINSKNKKINKYNNNEIISVKNLLNLFISEVFNLLKHQNSEIRKRAVYCCVEIHFAIGKDFEPFLNKIPKNQQNLIKLFIKKRIEK